MVNAEGIRSISKEESLALDLGPSMDMGRKDLTGKQITMQVLLVRGFCAAPRTLSIAFLIRL